MSFESTHVGYENHDAGIVQASELVRIEAFNSLDESILKDFILPLPFTGAEDVTESMLMHLLIALFPSL